MQKPKNIFRSAELFDHPVTVRGWIATRRDHGKLVFLDLRDDSGLLQIVIKPDATEAYSQVDRLKTESVVEITGLVKHRAEHLINPNLPTGTAELVATSIKLLAESETPPFEIGDSVTAGEEVRLEYRYLDLRSMRMQRNIRFRHQFIKTIRDFLDARDFVEVETPILTKSSPEGARDYLVPSRPHQGEFYALPQAPQQFKQLLMISGFSKYYQIARCFRDEDLRGDRQPEFTQLDLEMAFIHQDDILDLVEELMIYVVKTTVPDKKLATTKFPRLTYDEAITKYGSDKPDLRKDKTDPNELAFAWVTDFPMFEANDSGGVTFLHNPFARPHDEDLKLLESKQPADLLKVRAYSYDLVLNGVEISSGGLRIHDPKLQDQIFKLMGLSQADIERRFGRFLRAFKYGAPPHGGMAPGLDRLLMILLNEPSIREVIAFPKTGDARDLMMGAPSAVEPKQLKELGL